MEISNIEADDLDGLYKLYKANCSNNSLKPNLKDFHVWLVEQGYLDD